MQVLINALTKTVLLLLFLLRSLSWHCITVDVVMRVLCGTMSGN